MKTKELLRGLLAANYVYRYTPEKYQELKDMKSYHYPSPTRIINTSCGQLVEEVMQPVAQPITLNSEQIIFLERLARAWQKFLEAQMAIYYLARQNELAPESLELVKMMCTAAEWHKGLISPPYTAILPYIRLDAVLTLEGWKVFDINTTRPAGIGDMIAYDHFYHNQSFDLAHCFFQVLAQVKNEWVAGGSNGYGETVRFLINETDGDWRNFESLSKTLALYGMANQIIIPEQLSNNPTLIIRGRIKEGNVAYGSLSEKYPIFWCVVNPLYRRFLGNKLWFYLYRLDPFCYVFLEALDNDYYLLDKIFPTTGLVTVDNFVHFPADSEQTEQTTPLQALKIDDWVLKNPAGSSAVGMVVGCLVNQQGRQKFFSQIQPGWIVQRFYRARQELLVTGRGGELCREKLFTKYGLFLLNGQLGGLEFMARHHPIVHGARNTYYNSVWRQT